MRNNKLRLFEVMARMDKTFKPKLNEEFYGNNRTSCFDDKIKIGTDYEVKENYDAEIDSVVPDNSSVGAQIKVDNSTNDGNVGSIVPDNSSVDAKTTGLDTDIEPFDNNDPHIDTDTTTLDEEQIPSYNSYRVGQKIKSRLKNGAETISTITDIYSNGLGVNFDKPQYNKAGNLVQFGIVTVDNIIGAIDENYPAGADADPKAPWNQGSEDVKNIELNFNKKYPYTFDIIAYSDNNNYKSFDGYELLDKTNNPELHEYFDGVEDSLSFDILNNPEFIAMANKLFYTTVNSNDIEWEDNSLDEEYTTPNNLTFTKGWGYWDVTKYPYGGDFKRFVDGENGEIISGTVKKRNEIRVKLSDGRTIVCLAKTVSNMPEDEVIELGKKIGIQPTTEQWG